MAKELTMSISELQEQFEQIIDRIESGEVSRIFITEDGEAVAVLIKYEEYTDLIKDG